jgi:hypothetical protein
MKILQELKSESEWIQRARHVSDVTAPLGLEPPLFLRLLLGTLEGVIIIYLYLQFTRLLQNLNVNSWIPMWLLRPAFLVTKWLLYKIDYLQFTLSWETSHPLRFITLTIFTYSFRLLFENVSYYLPFCLGSLGSEMFITSLYSNYLRLT